MENKSIPIKSIPVWYWFVASLLLIWYIIGIVLLTGQVTLTEDALDMMTQSERQLYIDMPLWVVWAFALGVFGGFFGCVALLTKRKWAKYFIIASLIGIIAQIIYNLAMSGGLEVYAGNAILIPVLRVAIGIFAIWLSVAGIRRGWLR